MQERRKMQNGFKIDDDVIYKDVVIIGNGPSGICLSYMLAGNWPYYTGKPHPSDDMLTARLQFCMTNTGSEDYGDAHSDDAIVNNRHQCGKSGVGRIQGGSLARSTRCKLECLSSGIEGRGGGRPLALLMDHLQHPCVDAGLDVPSLLDWRSADEYPEHKIVDHVVLGKGQPGGSWQFMDPNVLTLSLSRWMSLPDLDLRHWEKLVEAEQLQESVLTTASDVYTRPEKLSVCKASSRISVGTVAAYYKDYVRRKGLKQYFRCGTTVTSVRSDSNSPESEGGYNWIVDGYENKSGKRFRYRCRRAVLATGTTDLSNHLGIPGEDTHPDWVTHDLNDLETRLGRLVNERGSTDEQMQPVLVIGAGLSAADAIMAARFRGIPVLHAFRNSSSEWGKETAERITTSYDRLQWLPNSIYPEYHKVYQMMADGGTNYPLYKSLPGYTLVSLSENREDENMNMRRTVIFSAPDGQLHTFEVSVAAILIGYKPDLSYLEGNGVGLGKLADKPIDSKSNPIEIDDFTYEVIKAPIKGLYALGPLTGNNFVRFVLGGALGILAHILCTTTSEKSVSHSCEPIVS
ncbi:oxidative stress-induced growth inhibitor 1-like [Cataglyphis hispanica]|uniref:oxidative stress-induced growth inhibitor 1-like n=1 Tax=Cataglyphis hispanica TaxID=1086592 RepID=UPI00217FEC17|nr:oxidative stress-induced growth inhibitor 1-like [Cataglyphis hispanica]XP_050450478.1 oxidative stress-induced growth inhibitor 1-like [Cataglyphis hispanica]XP_050450479.1 oxidative stress-induced growth inhibitor 1-like [Cataglyphis hispanica]